MLGLWNFRAAPIIAGLVGITLLQVACAIQQRSRVPAASTPREVIVALPPTPTSVPVSSTGVVWKTPTVSAEVTPIPTPTATAIPGTQRPTFSRYVALGPEDEAIRGGEPSLSVGRSGRLWITDIGPAQIWRSTDGGNTWTFIRPPVEIGGSDVDAAEDDAGRLHVVDQSGLDCIFYYRSLDGGETFDIVRGTHGGGFWHQGQGDCTQDMAGERPVDKPWVATWGDRTVYIVYGEAGASSIDYSHDGGVTFSHTETFSQARAVAVDPIDGTLYLVAQSGGEFREALGAQVEHVVGVAALTDGGRTFSESVVVDRREHDVNAGGFAALAVDRGHNVYVAWGDDSSGKAEIYLSVSGDHAKTWSTPTRVSTIQTTSTYPTIAAGDPGRVAIAWYGTADPSKSRYNAPGASWYVYLAISTDALADHPIYDEVLVASAPMHNNSICAHVNLCEGSVTETGGRPEAYEGGIADFFRIALDHDGWLNVVWTDTAHYRSTSKDHFAKQVAGTNLLLRPGAPALINAPPVPTTTAPPLATAPPQGASAASPLAIFLEGVLIIDAKFGQFTVVRDDGRTFYIKNSNDERLAVVLRPLQGQRVRLRGTIEFATSGDVAVFEVDGQRVPRP